MDRPPHGSAGQRQICEYIDDAVADVPLRPSDSWDVARVRLWTKQLDEGVKPEVVTAAIADFFGSTPAASK